MKQANVKILTDRLARHLEQLIELQDAMLSAIHQKAFAMRKSDVTGMLAGAAKEQEVAERIEITAIERGEIIRSICRELGLPALSAGREISLRALAARLNKPLCDELLHLSGRLRERMLAVGEANRTVELVCREMLVHFKTLFSAMVRDDGSPAVYHRDGEAGRLTGSRVLDAVG